MRVPVCVLLRGGALMGRDALRQALGFDGFFVYQNRVHLNTTRMEDKLQGKMQGKKLGKRLWRCRGAGPKYSEGDKVFKVYVTFSFHALAAVKEHIIKINHHGYSKKRQPQEPRDDEWEDFTQLEELQEANAKWDHAAQELYAQYNADVADGQVEKTARERLQHGICAIPR